MSAYIIDEQEKMMKIPFWCDEIGAQGSWMPLYIKVTDSGPWAGKFPTIEECKNELKRSLSYLSDLQPQLWMVKMPQFGEPMPSPPSTCGDSELQDDWVVNDRTALYIYLPMDTGNKLACDFAGHEDQNYVHQDKDEAEKAGTHHSLATPTSPDGSIKDWVAAKAQKGKANLGDIDIDEIYKMGFAAGMQKLQQKKAVPKADAESSLDSAASWQVTGQ